MTRSSKPSEEKAVQRSNTKSGRLSEVGRSGLDESTTESKKIIKERSNSGKALQQSRAQNKSQKVDHSKQRSKQERSKHALKHSEAKHDVEQHESVVDETPVIQGEKLQKVLARVGLGSRREMEKVIAEGVVTVNGKLAALGDRVNDDDTIEVNGQRVRNTSKFDQDLRVILYNKPEGEICSKSDPEGRPTVYENLPRLTSGRWISVGRLDFNTSGLLLFTNNGELANTLMHPSANIDREYLVRIQGEVDDDMLKRLRAGVELDDGLAKFTDIKAGSSEGSNWWFYCVVMEGRNREVRRLWESQGVRVSRLKRVRYGNIFIPSHVRVGQWTELDDKEMADLHLTAGLDAPRKSRFSNKGAETKERHQRKLRGSRSSSVSKKHTTKRESNSPHDEKKRFGKAGSNRLAQGKASSKDGRKKGTSGSHSKSGYSNAVKIEKNKCGSSSRKKS